MSSEDENLQIDNGDPSDEETPEFANFETM